jgi:hypothetical protein
VAEDLALVAVVVCSVAAVVAHFHDPRMGAQAAGRAVTQRVHNGGIYVCQRAENDGTIIGMNDVDYVCNAPNRPAVSGYWIGTDADSITDIEPNG